MVGAGSPSPLHPQTASGPQSPVPIGRSPSDQTCLPCPTQAMAGRLQVSVSFTGSRDRTAATFRLATAARLEICFARGTSRKKKQSKQFQEFPVCTKGPSVPTRTELEVHCCFVVASFFCPARPTLVKGAPTATDAAAVAGTGRDRDPPPPPKTCPSRPLRTAEVPYSRCARLLASLG